MKPKRRLGVYTYLYHQRLQIFLLPTLKSCAKSDCSKVFEIILYNKIVTHIIHDHSSSQLGFMAKTNMLIYTQNIAIDQNIQLVSAYSDFAKAFDKVPHNILLNKLKWFNFDNEFIENLIL